jgi:hypothetical protein
VGRGKGRRRTGREGRRLAGMGTREGRVAKEGIGGSGERT